MPRRTLLLLAFLLLFAASFFLARFPLYRTNLTGEDGIFAYLITRQPPGPDYTLLGRIDGRDIFNLPSHPAPNYELLRGVGKLSSLVIPYASLSDARVTLVLRVLISLFQFFVLGLWLALIFLASRRWSPAALGSLLLLFWLAALSPPALLHSIDPQIDTTAGVLFSGLCAAGLMVAAWDLLRGRWLAFALALAGFCMGLGKNEWSLMFLLAWLAVALFLWFLRHEKPGAQACLLLGGFLAGSLFNLLYDPANYLNGFKLMLHITGSASLVDGSSSMGWWELTRQRLPVILPILALLLAAFGLGLKNLKQISYPALFSFALGGALFMPFFLSTWSPYPRYFAPAFIFALSSFLLVFPRALPGRFQPAALLVLVLFFTAFDYAAYPHLPAYRPFTLTPRTECVPYLATAEAYRLPQIDFIGSSVGLDEALSYLNAHSKQLCSHN